MADELRPIFIARNEAEAHQVQSFLAASGIPSSLRRRAAPHRLFSLTPRGMEHVQILVNAADEDDARELLRMADAGEFHLHDEDVEP